MLLTLQTYTLATETKLHGYKELNVESNPVNRFAKQVNADSR